jgi:hypothetical protein
MVRELVRFRGRLATLLAGKEEVIPLKLGQNLYDRYSCPKRLWLDRRATHNTVIKLNAKWWREVSDFLLAKT